MFARSIVVAKDSHQSLLPRESSKVPFLPCGLVLFGKVIFRDPLQIPLKTSIKWTFLRLFLPRKDMFASQGYFLK